MGGERISAWGPDTVVRRRSRARPWDETLGLARTRIFVSRTILTAASYDAAAHAPGPPQGRLPALEGSSPAELGKPCSRGGAQDSQLPGDAGARVRFRQYEQGSARLAYGRPAPVIQAR